MKLTVEIKGLDKLIDSVADEQALSQALGQACALVERSAKEKAPKDTGELRRSITSEIRGNEGIIYTTKEYAPYVEYGTGLFAENGNGRKNVPWSYQDDEGEWHSTSGMKPQPFMRPALDENRERIIEIIKGAIK